jgi:hypothetical protein
VEMSQHFGERDDLVLGDLCIYADPMERRCLNLRAHGDHGSTRRCIPCQTEVWAAGPQHPGKSSAITLRAKMPREMSNQYTLYHSDELLSWPHMWNHT